MQNDEMDCILRWIHSDDRDGLINDPLTFLSNNIYNLPPHLLKYFESVTTPKQRTSIPIIKKRRLNWARSVHSRDTFTADTGRFRDPSNFEQSLDRDERGYHPSHAYAQDAGAKESQWLENESMMSGHAKLGKLGTLLSEYESERDSRGYTQSKASAIRNQDTSTLGKSILSGTDAFERLLLENWVDGVDDKLDYGIDFDDTYDTLNQSNPTELDEDIDQSKYFDSD